MQWMQTQGTDLFASESEPTQSCKWHEILYTYKYLVVLASVGSFWTPLGHLGLCWVILASVGSIRPLLGHFGLCWIILASVGSFWPLLCHLGLCLVYASVFRKAYMASVHEWLKSLP